MKIKVIQIESYNRQRCRYSAYAEKENGEQFQLYDRTEFDRDADYEPSEERKVYEYASAEEFLDADWDCDNERKLKWFLED